jgi:hypothetical protein
MIRLAPGVPPTNFARATQHQLSAAMGLGWKPPVQGIATARERPRGLGAPKAAQDRISDWWHTMPISKGCRVSNGGMWPLNRTAACAQQGAELRNGGVWGRVCRADAHPGSSDGAHSGSVLNRPPLLLLEAIQTH